MTDPASPSRCRARCRATHRPGFTLIEATISIALTGLLLLAALGTVGVTARVRQVQSTQHHGQAVARQLLSEILQHAYTEPEVDAGVFMGPDGAESSAPNRVTFDDVDDYRGWARTPPETRDGAALAGFAGWTRAVSVERVHPAAPDLPVPPTSETGLKRVIVTLTDPNGRQISLSALRASVGAFDHAVDFERDHMSWLGVDLQLGDRPDARMTSGVTLLNEAPVTLANLLVNPDIENGTTGWTEYEGCTLGTSTVDPHGGTTCLKVIFRSGPGAGAGQDLTSVLENGEEYELRVWIRQPVQTATYSLAIYTEGTGSPPEWITTGGVIVSGDWVRLATTFTPTWTGDLTTAYFKIQSTTTAAFRVDDAYMGRAP